MKVFNFLFKKKLSYILINISALLLGVCGALGSFWFEGNLALFLMSIGTALIAGALIAFLEIWRFASTNVIYAEIDDLVLDAGIERVYRKRDLDEYDALVKKAQSIDITGYSLRAFSQSYQDIIINSLSKNENFLLRMIVVSPDSEFSKNKEELEHNGMCRDVFRSSCEDLFAAFKGIPRVEIRVIDCALSTMIYRIDDVMYVGPQFVKEASKASFTMRIKRGGWVFSEYQEEFNKLWALGDDVTSISGGS